MLVIGQRPVGFSSNLSQHTCLEDFSNLEELEYIGSSTFNWGRCKTLQYSGLSGTGLEICGLGYM